MSLSNHGRRLSVAPLVGVERQGRGSLGSGSLVVGISCSLPTGSRFIQGTNPLPGLQSRFHPGQGLGGGSSFVVGQGSNRTGSSSFSGLLQPVIRGDESLRSVETGHRPLATESEGSKDILQDGDSPVSTSVSTSWGLDGVSRLEGCVLAGSDASGVSQVPQIRGVREGVPIQSSLLWPLHSSSGFHTSHGSCFGISSLDRRSVTSVSRQLIDPSLLSGAGPPCFGDSSSALQFIRDSRQLGEVSADSNSADVVSGSPFGLPSLSGLLLPSRESRSFSQLATYSCPAKAACVILAGAPWGAVLNDSAHSGREASNEIATVHSPAILGSGGSDCLGVLDSGDSSRSRMVARLRTSRAGRSSRSGVPSARLVVQLVGRGLGGASRGKGCFRPLVPRRVRFLNQRQRALRFFAPQIRNSSCRNFCGQLDRCGLSLESVRNMVSSFEFHRAADPTVVGDSSSSTDSPVHHGASQCSCGLVILSESSVGVRMDTQGRGVSRAPEEVAGVHRPVRHLTQSPMLSIFFTIPRSERSGYGCPAPELGWVAGVCLSTLVAHSGCSQEAPVILWVLLTIVAPYWPQRPWFPDLLDLVVDGPVALPLSRDLLRQPHFHRLHQGVSGMSLRAWRLSSDLPVLGASLSM